MTKVEIPLAQRSNRERLLDKTLEPLTKIYDYVLLDTNPTISNLNHSATYSADRLNKVCETQPYSLKGLSMLVQEIENFSDEIEQDEDLCIIQSKYDSKTVTSQEALVSLRHDYKEAVMESLVRKCEDINISAQRKIPIHEFCSINSMALEDIKNLANEILQKSTVKLEQNVK
ncbi:uncharacterized protein MT1749-like [Hydra vulgaris]|uniref:Uncharacterized protein MT1749-like n=1 Tax=Hydra vulgaris TaxID=6087 RepID=A0ABM4BMU0_HYDVU